MEERNINKEITIYFDEKKEIQSALLEFIENIDDPYNSFNLLTQMIEKQKICENAEELEHFLHLILRISNNHQRGAGFFNKIEQIMQYLEEYIKQTYSNKKIYNLFKSNKRIILFLLERGIITIDDFILKEMLIERSLKGTRDCNFFIPEIKQQTTAEKFKEIESEFYNIEGDKIDDNYDQLRRIGENDSYICDLIRNDKIEEFVSYHNKKSFSLSRRIDPSIYETNSFLIDKEPTLIEYSAFFGSIQIFKYLLFNKVNPEPSLWLYGIHSKNAEFIHLLEQLQIKLNDETYLECLKESIKCHHNDIADYIKDNLMNHISKTQKIAIQYDNYPYFNENLIDESTFYYLSKNKYNKIVHLILKQKQKDMTEIIVDEEYKRNICKFASKNQIIDIYHLLCHTNEINEQYFEYCKELETISLPDTIESISESSFNGCKALKQISIPTSVITIGPRSFQDCISLIKITIPPSVKSICSLAFDRCYYLTEISIPSSVTSIGESAFNECKSLTEIFLPFSITTINDQTFHRCSSLSYIFIPSTITTIGKSSFKECTSLLYITMPASVKSIGSYAFDNCSKLEQISIPASVASIGEYAFNECTSITQISIPTLVKSIEKCTFRKCTSLKQISIPASVTSIGEYAFNECTSLQQISFTVPSSETQSLEIGPKSFSYCGIKSITIPKHASIIGDFAFYQCKYLKSVEIEKESKLLSIGESAFSETPITKISIPDQIEFIKKRTFFNCCELTEVIFSINSELTSIESEAFSNSKLKQIFLPNKFNHLNKKWSSFTPFLETVKTSTKNHNFINIGNKILIGKSEINDEKHDFIYLISCDFQYYPLKWKDIPDQYKLMINKITNNTIRDIYSKFLFKYNDNQDCNIDDLFHYLSKFKFITCYLMETNIQNVVNCVFCVEGECLIIENTNILTINNLIKLLNALKISLINIDNHHHYDSHYEEVKNIVDYFMREIRQNEFVKYTIKPIFCYIISRYYYPSNYFKDTSFFIFSNTNDLDSINKHKLKNYLIDENKTLSIKDIANGIKTNNKATNLIQEFHENDFIYLRSLYINSKYAIYLAFHLQSHYIFAIKRFNESREYFNELEIKFCKNYSNQCFTKFYGFIMNKDKVKGIVYEFMCNDSLNPYIRNKKIDDMHLLITTSRIFNGIEYLYKNHLLHRDIKPSSILIDHNNLAYISNFGTIRTADLTDGEFENDIGSFLYASPEQDGGDIISYPTDIYSFGCVIYFLFEKNNMHTTFDDKFRNTIKKMNKGSSNIQQIYENCVKFDPDDRMTHEQIKTILNKEFQNISRYKELFINEKHEINIDNVIDYYYEMILNQQTDESLSFCCERIQEFRYLLLFQNQINESFNQLLHGLCYYYGFNIEQNYIESKKCLEISLQINSIADVNSFEITEQFKQEYSESFEYNSKIAKIINSYCYFYLGNHYFHGLGVLEDYQKGIEFYKKSSELNNYYAHIKLCNIYEAGQKNIMNDL